MKSSYDGIIGLALADAMGVPVEFKSRTYLKKYPVTSVKGHGTYDQPAGYWSDDTSLTIAAMDAIIANAGVINEKTYKSIAGNFVSYYKYGSFTPGGRMFDIGSTTANAILKYASGGCRPYEAGGTEEINKGNGALMRILPIAYYSLQNGLSLSETYDIVKKTAFITHGLDTCALGSFIYVIFAIQLLQGKSKEESYSQIQSIDYSAFVPQSIVDEYARILRADIKNVEEDQISSKGKTLPTLEAAMWSFMKNNSYKDTVLQAINLGDDTDTVGAVAGGLAGICYGAEAIPKEWLSKLAKSDYLTVLCKAFDESVENKSVPPSYNQELKHSGRPNEPYHRLWLSIFAKK